MKEESSRVEWDNQGETLSTEGDGIACHENMHYSKEISSPCWYTYSSECNPILSSGADKTEHHCNQLPPTAENTWWTKKGKATGCVCNGDFHIVLSSRRIIPLQWHKMLWDDDWRCHIWYFTRYTPTVIDQILSSWPQSSSLGRGHSKATEPTPST